MSGTHAENQLRPRSVAQKIGRRRGRPRAFDNEVVSAVEVLAANGYSAAAIEQRLKRRFGDRPIPAVRTIQQLLSDLAVTDAGDAWSVLDARDNYEAAVVLPILAYVITMSGGARHTLTRMEARAVARIHAVAPELCRSPKFLWTMAYLYVTRQQHGSSTLELDLVLAKGPWISEEHEQDYADSCKLLGIQPLDPSQLINELFDDDDEPITRHVGAVCERFDRLARQRGEPLAREDVLDEIWARDRGGL